MTQPGALNTDWTLISLYTGADSTPYNSVGAVTEKTVASQLAVSHNELCSTSSRLHEYWFQTAPILYAGATYRVGFSPQVAANGLYVNYINQVEAADWQGWPFGQSVMMSTRLGTGNWTDNPLARLMGEVIIGDMAGRPGVLVHPGMAGRLSG
jgi:hypothetical protein